MKKRSPTLTDQIRQAVETCGKTRYQIAQETGVDQASLCRFVSGERGLSVENLDLVAECIGLRVVVEGKPKKRKAKR